MRVKFIIRDLSGGFHPFNQSKPVNVSNLKMFGLIVPPEFRDGRVIDFHQIVDQLIAPANKFPTGIVLLRRWHFIGLRAGGGGLDRSRHKNICGFRRDEPHPNWDQDSQSKRDPLSS